MTDLAIVVDIVDLTPDFSPLALCTNLDSKYTQISTVLQCLESPEHRQMYNGNCDGLTLLGFRYDFTHGKGQRDRSLHAC